MSLGGFGSLGQDNKWECPLWSRNKGKLPFGMPCVTKGKVDLVETPRYGMCHGVICCCRFRAELLESEQDSRGGPSSETAHFVSMRVVRERRFGARPGTWKSGQPQMPRGLVAAKSVHGVMLRGACGAGVEFVRHWILEIQHNKKRPGGRGGGQNRRMG